ncbi:MAG: translation initiation factor IF-5A [Acidilobaceae archaeon]
MSINYATLGDLKKGSFIVIDGEPCKIVDMSTAKTGKHGSAKAHVVAIGVFTGQKRTLIAPVDTRVQVPVIEKRVGQVLADMGDRVQIMDMETYETLEIEKPVNEPELVSKLSSGVTVEYWIIMNKPKIIRIRGGEE